MALATALDCPLAGEFDPDGVADAWREVSRSGAGALCLADTVGVLLPTSAFLAEQLEHDVPALLPPAGTFP